MTCEFCADTRRVAGTSAPCRACAPDAPYLSGLTESDVCKGVECRHPSHGTDAPDGFEAEVFALREERDQLRGEVLGFRSLLGEADDWMCGNPPATGWGTLDHSADKDRREIQGRIRAALLGGAK
jgi:hypothetical protein